MTLAVLNLLSTILSNPLTELIAEEIRDRYLKEVLKLKEGWVEEFSKTPHEINHARLDSIRLRCRHIVQLLSSKTERKKSTS